MRHQMSAVVVALALLGSVSIATAQTASGGASAQGKLDLTSSQQQQISQALANQPSQSAPSGLQAQVGSKLPASLNAQALPSNVTAQIPEARGMQFIKLSDRVLLIDPATKQIASVIPAAGTTGSGAGSSGMSGSGSTSGGAGGTSGGSSGGAGSSGSRY